MTRSTLPCGQPAAACRVLAAEVAHMLVGWSERHADLPLVGRSVEVNEGRVDLFKQRQPRSRY